jgi:Mycobacterium membrane protein
MTDSPYRGSPYDPNRPGGGYPVDPAYAGNSPYGPTYAAVPPPSGHDPTEPPSQYWTQTSGQIPPPEPPPPPPPRSPRWLVLAAATAILLVVGLVIALVIVASSANKQTVVAPLPAMPSPSTTTTSPTTTRPLIPIPVLPLPNLPTTGPTTSAEPTTPGETEPVVYEVTGNGRAINITYVDSGNMMQTEFNVMLPWSKQVDLPKPAADSASVTVINVGRNVTCSITISGVQVRQRTGAGLTICSPYS